MLDSVYYHVRGRSLFSESTNKLNHQGRASRLPFNDDAALLGLNRVDGDAGWKGCPNVFQYLGKRWTLTPERVKFRFEPVHVAQRFDNLLKARLTLGKLLFGLGRLTANPNCPGFQGTKGVCALYVDDKREEKEKPPDQQECPSKAFGLPVPQAFSRRQKINVGNMHS